MKNREVRGRLESPSELQQGKGIARGDFTLRNSCPTAPVTPTIARDGPLSVFAACTLNASRLRAGELYIHLD